MEKVIQAKWGELEKECNRLILENPDMNCQMMNIAIDQGVGSRATFRLTKISPEERTRKIGEYAVIIGQRLYEKEKTEKDFENKVNEMNPEEGWQLVTITYPLAVFSRDVENTMKSMGFENVEEFTEFERSGCPVKIIFTEHKQNIGEYLAKIDEIHQDAEWKYEQKQFGDYIRLAYLEVEKIVEALYCVHNHVNDTRGNKFSDLLVNLGGEFGIHLVNEKELKEWREVRNKFVHENQKVTLENAQEAKMYFDETTAKLKKLLQHLPYAGKLAVDLEDFKKRKIGDTGEERMFD
ncbi:MAG: hypothetical protein RBG13Loki_1594 [Promethearchaeota archaeon CR_4]|nr:MAG: hypothetical protein RBG13Loki_1594 [Candidatus Lokiarchaeota archaeon CR_4]